MLTASQELSRLLQPLTLQAFKNADAKNCLEQLFELEVIGSELSGKLADGEPVLIAGEKKPSGLLHLFYGGRSYFYWFMWLGRFQKNDWRVMAADVTGALGWRAGYQTVREPAEKRFEEIDEWRNEGA